MICNKLVEQNVIQNVNDKTFFVQNDLYKFYFDKEHIADNLLRNWRHETGNAYDVSIQLVKRAEEMYACSIIQDEDGDPVLDIEQAMKSNEYKLFINSICELEKVSIRTLCDTKRIAFFLNVYQCMYVHNFFKMISEGRTGDGNGYLKSLSSYFTSDKPKFCYNIAGISYTLDDIKHGMLRGNKCKPGHMMRILSTSDQKTQIIPRLI